MPRVMTTTRHKSGRGRDVSCGKCGEKIEPGQQYRHWSFRYGGKRVRCMKPECSPRPSDLTQSKMGVIYDGQQDLGKLTDAAEVKDALEAFAETVREVASEYEEAAEHFGGQGENQERYEMLDSWADDIEQAVSDLEDAIDAAEKAKTVEREVECETCGGSGEVEAEEQDDDAVDPVMEPCDDCGATGMVENPDYEEMGEEELDNAVEEARGVADECPI